MLLRLSNKKCLTYSRHFIEVQRLPEYWAPLLLRLAPLQRLCSLCGSVASASSTRRGQSGRFYRTHASGIGGWPVKCRRASRWKKMDFCCATVSQCISVIERGWNSAWATIACTDWLKQKIFHDQVGKVLNSAFPHCPNWTWLGLPELFQGIGGEKKFSGDPAIGTCPNCLHSMNQGLHNISHFWRRSQFIKL